MDVHTKPSYTSTGTEKDSGGNEPKIHNCVVRKRVNPQRRKDKVYVGCGAGFGGDRPLAALKLLQRVKQLNYLVLECLAERTLSDRYKAMKSGGVGYDPRIQEWMHLLLPLAVERGVCIITNMGANDACAAQKKVLETASTLGISITVGVAYQVEVSKAGLDHHMGSYNDTTLFVVLDKQPRGDVLTKFEEIFDWKEGGYRGPTGMSMFWIYQSTTPKGICQWVSTGLTPIFLTATVVG